MGKNMPARGGSAFGGKNIVLIGGGTGTSTLLRGLKKYSFNLTVVVSTADDGGSNARIRKDFGIIPPSDIRQCLLALSAAPAYVKDLFSFRFSRGELKGHTAGNLVFAAFYEIYQNLELALAYCSELLQVQGQVLPVTLKPQVLSATLSNGQEIISEHKIDEPRTTRKFPIKDLHLESSAPVNPKVLKAIAAADVIVFGPGDLYTSTLPNLLVKGVMAAIEKSKAKKILVTNIMTKHGQTDGFAASDFVKVLRRYLGKAKLNLAIVNKQRPASKWLLAYKKERAEFVPPDLENIKEQSVKAVAANLISEFIFKRTTADKLKRSFLRHNSTKLAKLIKQLT